jgi:hypothetical protein
MGFNRIIVDKEKTKKYLNLDKLNVLYKSDSISFDDSYSTFVYSKFIQGYDVKNIKELLKQESYEMY